MSQQALFDDPEQQVDHRRQSKGFMRAYDAILMLRRKGWRVHREGRLHRICGLAVVDDTQIVALAKHAPAGHPNRGGRPKKNPAVDPQG